MEVRPMMAALAALACVITSCVAGCTSDNRVSAGDGGVACIDFDLSKYDKFCQEDSDCINVNAGMICDRGCMCGGHTINADAQAAYSAAFSVAVASLPPGMSCSCPAFGKAQCIQKQCVYCPNPATNAAVAIPPGCPDGG
jgi:hypothetical protein